jgi:hypothetical protein
MSEHEIIPKFSDGGTALKTADTLVEPVLL